jgi:hypothetical protein
MALAKINSEMEILKKDLEKNVDEIIQNCYNDKIELLEKNNIESSKNVLNKSSSQQNINTKFSNLKPLKSLQHSQSSIFNNSVPNSRSPNNIHNIRTIKNLDTVRNNNRGNLSIFTKFKILKSNKPLKLGNSFHYKANRNVSMFVTNEVIDFSKKSYEEKELEKEIKKIDENDYQQLIDLKGNYVDINDRLDKDIKDKKRICLNRINQLNICVENNLLKLDKMKKTNEIMKKELEEFEQKIMKK